MNEHKAAMDAFESTVSARLDAIKAKLDGLKAQAKANAAHTELEAIEDLQHMQKGIESKRELLKKAEATKFDSMRESISADVKELETKVSALHHKVEHLVATK